MTSASQSELFRLAASVDRDCPDPAAEILARDALEWAARDVCSPLPPSSSMMQPFSFRSGNARCTVARATEDDLDLWAMRTDAPDAKFPELIRSTEVVVEHRAGGGTALTVRQLVDRNQHNFALLPEVPGFVHSASTRIPLVVGNDKLNSKPWTVDSAEGCWNLIETLLDNDRAFPVVIVTELGAGSATASLIPIAPEPLARATVGLATVVVLAQAYTHQLTDHVGRNLSVFGGGARIYRPGFDHGADRNVHKLWLPERLKEASSRAQAIAEIRRIAAKDSRERFRNDLIAFGDVQARCADTDQPTLGSARSNALKNVAEGFSRRIQAAIAGLVRVVGPTKAAIELEGARIRITDLQSRNEALEQRIARIVADHEKTSVELVKSKSQIDGLQAQAAKSRRAIKSMQSERKQLEGTISWLSREHDVAEKQGKKTRAEVSKVVQRNKTLERQIALIVPDWERDLPVAWEEFPAWCEDALAGRVMLLEQAKREIKKARFGDVVLGARGVLWLGRDYRARRRNGGNGDLLGPILDGKLFNARCGNTRFSVSWCGRQMPVDWHLKNGGNTHDPTRCLRIYYLWDDVNDQVVIVSMPAHR